MRIPFLTASSNQWQGIIWTLISTIVGSAGDIMMRFALDESVPQTEELFIRTCFVLLWLAAPMTVLREWPMPSNAIRPSLAARSFCDAIQSICFVLALSTGPFAIATGGFCTLSIWMTILSVFVLHEKVGWRRWSAAVAGFCGVYLIVRPATGDINGAALFGIATGIVAACRDIFTRRIGVGLTVCTVMFVGSVTILLASLCGAAFQSWRALHVNDYLLLTPSAAFYISSAYALIRGLRVGEVSLTAPFRYFFPVWGLLAGYLIFGEFIDSLSLVGLLMILASGVFTAWREARLHRGKLASLRFGIRSEAD